MIIIHIDDDDDVDSTQRALVDDDNDDAEFGVCKRFSFRQSNCFVFAT